MASIMEHSGNKKTRPNDRNLPFYMPQTQPALLRWLDQYIATALVSREEFPAVFDTGGVYSAEALAGLRACIGEAVRSENELRGVRRGVTAWKNALLFSKTHGPLERPLAEPGMMPSHDAAHSGIVGMIRAQVALLRSQPGFTQALQRLRKARLRT